MGANLYLWIEYDTSTDDVAFSNPESIECLPLCDWVNLSHAKDYHFIGAISGCRNHTDIKPLIALRGCPDHLSYEFTKYKQEMG